MGPRRPLMARRARRLAHAGPLAPGPWARRAGPARARDGTAFIATSSQSRPRGGARGMAPALSSDVMLKITLKTHNSGYHLKLEGELAGSSVRDLEISWRLAARAAAVFSLPVFVDLADCSRVDDAGHYLLALLHLNGTHLVASGVATTGLVESLAREWPVPTFPEERKAPCA